MSTTRSFPRSLFRTAFPLRVVQTDDDWQIWTAHDPAPGSRNNFAICCGIQSDEEAHWICATLNSYRETP